MNKNLHRIVFNAARGIRMVVQETARSAGKSSTRHSGLGVALAALLDAGAAHPQIIGAANVPGSQRPTVLVAPNGVPLVNIQTPSAAGVSRNIYSSFNVAPNGAILNNSRTQVQTQLGGWVQGNPSLATGSARVILNEVNSGNPSLLNGYVEVAGQRAEVIIANPAGIQVDGGGFINASRATLTTGVPQINAFGGLDGYRVGGGTISVDGKGLDLSGTDYAGIYARALQVNAGIWASELKAVTGANEIGADDAAITPIAGAGPAPVFALDVAALGGMYANKIVLIGTEAGLGVRNAGAIQASANGTPSTLAGVGQLVVTSAGRLETSGTLQADTQLAVDAPSIANSGTIAAGADLHLATSAGDLANSGLMQAPHLDLASAAQIDNRGGTIRQTSGASLTLTAPSLSNTAGGTIGPEPVADNSASGGSGGSGGSTSSPPPSSSGGTGETPPSTSTASAGTTTPPAPITPPQPGTITAASAILNDAGHIEAGGPIHLATPQINNAGGNLSVAELSVSGASFSNAGGTVSVANAFNADVGTLDNTGGQLSAGSVAVATTGDLLNQDGVIQSSGDATFDIGRSVINTGGAITSAGVLSMTVGGDVANNAGQLIANNALTLSATSIDNTAGVIASTQDSVQLHAAGALLNTGGITARRDVTITADSLSGAGLLAAGVQADGTLAGAGDLHVSTSGTLAANGQNLAAGDATLQGASIDLADSTTSAANIALTAGQGDIVTSGATVVTPGALTVHAEANAAQTWINQGGTVSASALDVRAANLDNSAGGQLLQTGSTAASVTVAGQINNDAGVIASNGPTTIDAGALSNRAGVVRAVNGASLDLIVAGALDNSQAGDIGADGNATLQAGSLKNDGGSITAGGDFEATLAQAASNVDGTLAANGNTTITAASLDSTRGTIAAIGGDLRVTTTGITSNTEGALLASGEVTLDNGGLDNTAGKAVGQRLVIDTHGGALGNAQGTLAALTTVSIDSGALANDAGLIQSGEAMTIDTHGQQLTNTQTLGDQLTDPGAAPQGILSGSTLQLATGALDNTLGLIRSADAMSATTGDFTNDGGAVLGGSTIAIAAQAGRFANQGGQVQAMDDVGIGAAVIDNSAGGLIRSGATTTLAAASIDNSATLGTDQGIEGAEVAINAGSLNNTSGAIRANGNATITSGGTIANTNGLISAADTLTLQDPNHANPTAKTLSLLNTGGTLAGGTVADPANGLPAFGGIVIDAANYQLGDGTLASANDLTIALTQDIANSATLSTSGNLSLSTTGSITNAAGGELSGRNTHLVANTVTNRGLIDSNGETRIDAAGSVTNLGTGRIYGDHVAIGTGTLTNDQETVGGITTSGTIASRGDLDIGAATVNNNEQALIFSAADMRIGGALDADAHATGQGGVLNNHSADIESLGDMTLSMGTIDNRDTHIQLGPQETITYQTTTIAALGGTQFYTLDQVIALPGSPFIWERNPDGSQGALLGSSGWGIWNTTYTTTQDTAINARAASIVSGGDMTIDGALINSDSKVMAGGTLTASTPPQNFALQGTYSTSWFALVTNQNGALQPLVIGPTTSGTFNAGAYTYVQHVNGTTGYDAGTAGTGGGGPSASGAGQAKAGQGAATILQVPSAVGPGDGVTDPGAGGSTAPQSIPTVVRTSSPNSSLPTASLFRVRPNGSGYLIETDPRFADYRHWLSSDYLLNNLGLDSDNMLKRLGDGFYEQKLIREQVAQLTGYRYLDGFQNDEEQYLALMNAGVTFAKEYGLVPGVALTPAQMAQLTSDIVWLVEQTVTLPDGTTQQVLVPQVYVRVQPGDIDGSGALLSADRTVIKGSGDLTNTGTIAGRTLVSINADNVNNLAGGRIDGGVVAIHATNDLNNIGASITAKDAAVLTAGNDINIRTTTASGSAGNINIDRIAGVYVSNPGGMLIASAGNDVDIVAGVLASAGTAAVGAGHDIKLGTVITSSTATALGNNIAGVSTQSAEVGAAVVANGNVLMVAGNDIKVRASTVASAEGDLTAIAGHDINLEAGQSTSSVATASASSSSSLMRKNTQSAFDSTSTTDVLSSTLAGNTVVLYAGNDINAQAAQLISQNEMYLGAGRDINFTTANQGSTELHASQESSTSTALSKAWAVASDAGGPIGGYGNRNFSGNSTSADTRTVAVGTTISAGSLSTFSGRDTTLYAASIVADGDITMQATRNLTIGTAQNTEVSASSQANAKSGFIGSWSKPGLGNIKGFQADASSTTTQTGSQIASLNGNVKLTAGETYTQTGSSVLAAGLDGTLQGGNVDIRAKNVLINEAYDTSQTISIQRSSATQLGGSASVGAFGLSLSTNDLHGGGSGTLGQINNNLQALGQTSDTRAQALGGLNLAMQGKQAYDGVSQLASGASPGSTLTYGVSVSLSRSTAQGTSIGSSSTARGSSILAANDVNITATGGGEDSNLRVVGSTIAAGNTVNLKADNDVILEASKSTNVQTGQNSSHGASVGVTLGAGAQTGLSVQLGVQNGRGSDNQMDVVNNATTVTGGNAVNITSGRDLTLNGAVVEGNRVTADVGGNLNITTLQDIHVGQSDQSSSGFGVSICVPPICGGAIVTASGNAASASANGVTISPNTQSGIKAGDGGFDVNVKGNTTLVGGVIESTQAAVDAGSNSFKTGGTLTMVDLQNVNQSGGEAHSINPSLSIGSSTLATDTQDSTMTLKPNGLDLFHGLTSALPANVGTSSVETSMTTSGISGIAGNTSVRTGDNSSAGILVKDWNTNALLQDVKAQAQVRAQINTLISNEANKFADEAYRTMFEKKMYLYKLSQDESGNRTYRKLTEEERQNLEPAADGKVHVANNGIFNDLEGAAKYANQHSSAVDGPQYFLHLPEADNAISELMIAGYQKFLEGDLFDLTNASKSTQDLMLQYGIEGLQLDCHSRGSLTCTNAMTDLANQGLVGVLSGTTMYFFGPAQNVANAEKTLNYLQGAGNQNSILYQNNVADPIGRLIGLNPATGGTVPDGNTLLWEMLRAATGQPITSHNCYG